MHRPGVTRRELLAGGTSMAALLAFGGCGAGSSTAGDSRAAPLDAAATDYLRSVGNSLGTTSLSILAYAAPQAQAIQELSGQFTELTGIDLNWTLLDEQGATNKASVALGSGAGGYDIVQTTSSLMPTYAGRGWLAPFASLAREHPVPGWDAGAYGETVTRLLTAGDELLAAPNFIGTQLFFYRTDLFERAGITETPTTYQELAAACSKLGGPDVDPIALRSAPSPSQLMFVWSAWLYAFGGSYYRRRAGTDYSEPDLNTQPAVDALATYCDLLQNRAPSGATNWSVEDAVRAFTTGRVAIIQEGATFSGTFNDPETSQVAGKVGTFVLPEGPAGQYVPFNCHAWGVAGNSGNPEAAAVFAQWATLERTLTSATRAQTPFSTPPLTAVYESEAYQDRFGFDDYVDDVISTIELANDGGVSPIEGDPNYLPGTPDWNTIGQRVCEELSRAVTGQVSPAEAIGAAAEAMEAGS